MTLVSILLCFVVLPLVLFFVGSVQRDRLGVISRRDALREVFLRLYRDASVSTVKLQRRAYRRAVESLTELPDGRVLLPSLIVIEVAPGDFDQIDARLAFGEAIAERLSAEALRRGWRVPVEPVVRVVRDDRRTRGWPYARSRHVADTEQVDDAVPSGNARRRGIVVRSTRPAHTGHAPVPGACLQAVTGDVPDVLLLDDQPVLIGRVGATVSVGAHTVSRNHCEISLGAQGWTVRDLGSANGTYLNGRPVHGADLLRPMDVLSLGPDVEFVYVVPDPVGYRPRRTE